MKFHSRRSQPSPSAILAITAALKFLFLCPAAGAAVDAEFGEDGTAVITVAGLQVPGCTPPCTIRLSHGVSANGARYEPPEIAVQSDGKILVLGMVELTNGPADSLRLALFRLNIDGSLDESFGEQGFVTLRHMEKGGFFGGRIVLQPDGRILVGGYAHGPALFRFLSDGTPDASFGEGGLVFANPTGWLGAAIRDFALQSDGRIIAILEWLGTVVVRYETDGSVDTSFDGGIWPMSSPYFGEAFAGGGFSIELFAADRIAIQADDRILLSGSGDANVWLARLEADGSLDTGFINPDDPFGVERAGFLTGAPFGGWRARDVAVQADGKIVLVGQLEDPWDSGFSIIRYESDGSADIAFGDAGVVTHVDPQASVPMEARVIRVQPDQKLLVLGDPDGIRLHPNGQIDRTVSPTGILTGGRAFAGESYARSLALDSEGRILVGHAVDSRTVKGLSVTRLLPRETALLPSGPEIRINTTVAGSQVAAGAALAAAAGGNVIATWTSEGQDGSGTSVHAQFFDRSGVTLGTETQVHTTVAGDQHEPSASTAASGGFAVVWQSDGQDGDQGGIFARVYDKDGAEVGGEFQANSISAGSQQNPSVGSASDGTLVVAWDSDGQDGSGRSVQVRRFLADSTPAGSEQQVNSSTGGDQQAPSVAVAPNGKFIVAWQSTGQDGDGTSIHARRYNADGTPAGAEFPVNTATQGNQLAPVVSAAADGSFAIVWTSAGDDGDGSAAVARVFDRNGTAVGEDFVINTWTSGDQADAVVSAIPSGGYLSAWTSSGQDGDGSSVHFQKISSTGVLHGPETQANETTAGDQERPSIVTVAGDVFVAWTSASGQDSSEEGVYAQRFCADSDSDAACDARYFDKSLSQSVAAGTTVTTDTDGDGATPEDPFEASVTTPLAGQVTIYISVVSTDPPVLQADITAPQASVDVPLTLVFRVDATLAQGVSILRNGVALEASCYDNTLTVAAPDPCIASVVYEADGDAVITVYTSAASSWRTEGENNCPPSPTIGCIEGGQSSLQLIDDAMDARDQLKWKLSGAPVSSVAPGDPTGTANYSLCVYTRTGNERALLVGLDIASGDQWIDKGNGSFQYKDKSGRSDGVRKARFSSGDKGVSVQVAAKGGAIPAIDRFSDGMIVDPSADVFVHFLSDESFACWTSPLTRVQKNGPVVLKGSTP